MISRPINVFDPDFDRLMKIFVAQQQAVIDNQHAHDNFVLIASNWTIAANHNPNSVGPAPVPPKMIVVADSDGSIGHADFPDLVIPSITSQPSTDAHGFGFGGVAGGPVAPDRTDQIISMLRAIAQKVGVTGA